MKSGITMPRFGEALRSNQKMPVRAGRVAGKVARKHERMGRRSLRHHDAVPADKLLTPDVDPFIFRSMNCTDPLAFE